MSRALIARGVGGAAVMATDSPTVAGEIERIGTGWVLDVFGGDDFLPARVGLYLWEGVAREEYDPGTDSPEGPAEPNGAYIEFDGDVRAVKPGELDALLAMRAP
jgi:hypothetical protein